MVDLVMHTKLTTAAIDMVLMTQWDPIDVKYDLPATVEEYTRYAAVVWELVVDATTREDAVAMIAAYLTWVRCEMIGLGDREPRGGVEKEVAIAQRLLTLSDQLTNR